MSKTQSSLLAEMPCLLVKCCMNSAVASNLTNNKRFFVFGESSVLTNESVGQALITLLQGAGEHEED